MFSSDFEQANLNQNLNWTRPKCNEGHAHGLIGNIQSEWEKDVGQSIRKQAHEHFEVQVKRLQESFVQNSRQNEENAPDQEEEGIVGLTVVGEFGEVGNNRADRVDGDSEGEVGWEVED